MSDFAEVRLLLAEQGRSLGRIEGALATMQAGAEADRAERGGLEGRLRKVEQRQHWYAGFAAAIGAFVSAVLTLHTRSS